MKIKVVGKARLTGASKKAGNPYGFIQIHYLGRACGITGDAALTVSLDPSVYPYEKIAIPSEAVIDFDNRGYPVEFTPVSATSLQREAPPGESPAGCRGIVLSLQLL